MVEAVHRMALLGQSEQKEGHGFCTLQMQNRTVHIHVYGLAYTYVKGTYKYVISLKLKKKSVLACTTIMRAVNTYMYVLFPVHVK